VEIGNQLREEMGGQRFANNSTDVFEAADPARTMPKWLVLGAIAAVVVLIAAMSWLNNRSLEQPEETSNVAAPSTGPAAPAPKPAAPAPAAPADGPVVLNATAPVWLQVSEKGGPTLFSGMLQPGQTYTVPASSAAPVLKTGKPEALKITVGSAIAAPVGPPATTVSNVSLRAADLMKAQGSVPGAIPAAAATRAEVSRPRPRRTVAAPPKPATAQTPQETPPTNNTGE
jgi:hypothetical protein